MEKLTDDQIDAIYRSVNDLLFAGLLDIVDAILKGSDPDKMGVDKILSLLVTTRPTASQLPSRPEFFRKCWKAVEARDRDVKKLLTGLEFYNPPRF
jgi:hypothetical protein